MLDGAPNNAQAGTNNIALVPPVDSVQEFKVQTNSYDSQYGHSGGGVVNVSLKSGTNSLHGTAYEFARRNSWDANSFQNNAAGAARVGHYLDQYGIQAGGPVYLPKIYNGRDKSFFMANYEGYREGTPGPLTLSVPEPEMRNGDFSRLVDSQGRKITIYDPATGRDVNGTWTRDAFPNNVIPAGRVNPVAQKVLSYMRKPNRPAPAGQAYSQQNLFIPGGDQLMVDGFYNFVAKFDQKIGAKHSLFWRHASNARFQERNTNGLFSEPGTDGYYRHQRINTAEVLDWVSTLSPTLVLNARISWNRYVEKNGRGQFPNGNEGFDITTLGFPASLAARLPHKPNFGVYAFTNYTGLGAYPTADITNNWGLQPNVTWVRSSHSFKFGVDMRSIQYITNNPGSVLSLSASPSNTQRDFARGDLLSGDSIASWLLGTPTTGSSVNNLFPTFQYLYFAPYVQDDWKLTRRLTVNLGLRWDFNVPAKERYNRLNRGFDGSAINPIDAKVNKAEFPELGSVRGSLLFAGVNGNSRTAANLYKKALQPRIGAAYQVTPRVAVRGGWGLYYLNPNNDYLQTNGFSTTTSLVNSLDGGRTYLPNMLNNPFPEGLQVPSGSSLGGLTFLGRGFNFVNPSFRIPKVHQFSLNVQYELVQGVKIEAGYVGSRTVDLQTTRPFNASSLQLRQQCNLMEGGSPAYCDALVRNPFYGMPEFAGTSYFSSQNVTRATLAVPYPAYGALTEVTRNDGAAWYNSMQVTVETRRRAGANIIATYTLSKNTYRTGFNDVQRGIMQQGIYQFDRTHRLTFAAVYQLPFGEGRRLLNTSSRFWRRVASGWETTLMLQAQSGLPWALPSNVLYVKEAKVDNIDWSSPRIYGVKPCVARWNDNNTITMQPFSTQAGCTDYNFLVLPRYAPRLTPNYDGRLRLHAVPTADMSVNKRTKITENTAIQFRAEAFNVFNTYYFYGAQFINNPEITTFGSVDKASVATGSANYPRYIQLGVKFIW
jgi:outer membrane receptor protein involved in Fe transport